MALTAAQLSALEVILRAADEECRRSPVGNLLEAHLKVVAVDALLTSGHSVMEGANVPGQGRVLSLQNGRLKASLQPRPRMPAAPGSSKTKNSPDIRVWEPCRLVVELQIRTLAGSQSALFSANLADDIDRVERGTADVFVLASDFALYESLRGLKLDPRGRKAKHTVLFASVLPAVPLIPPNIGSIPGATYGGRIAWLGSRFSTSFGIERVVVGLWAAA